MKKIDWNHAMTRKDYAIVWGLLFVYVMLFYGALTIMTFWSNIKSWTCKMKDKIRTKLPW